MCIFYLQEKTSVLLLVVVLSLRLLLMRYIDFDLAKEYW
jgi:hypothetical protein